MFKLLKIRMFTISEIYLAVFGALQITRVHRFVNLNFNTYLLSCWSLRPSSDVELFMCRTYANELKQELSSLTLDSAHEKFDV